MPAVLVLNKIQVEAMLSVESMVECDTLAERQLYERSSMNDQGDEIPNDLFANHVRIVYYATG